VFTEYIERKIKKGNNVRVLMIGMGWFPQQAGGLNRVFQACATHLPAEGIDNKGLVVGFNEAKPLLDGRIEIAAQRSASLPHRAIGMRQAVKRALSDQEYDLVASHFALHTLPVLDLLDERPLVVHFHGPWAAEGQAAGQGRLGVALKHMIEQRVYRRAVRCIVLSHAFKEILNRDYGIPNEVIRIVPGGTDCPQALSLTKAEARAQLGWPEDKFIVAAVRRLTPRMGLENLVEAAAHLQARRPEVLWKIAGEGTLRPTLEQHIARHQLEDTVQLLGFVPDNQLPLVYAAADVSLVPTLSLEGFGLIVVESLAAGTPVLGTPVGGIPEILRPLSSDLVLSGCHIEDLVNGVEEVLSGKRSLPSRESCRSYVESHYSWTRCAESVRQVYEDALSAGT
jgi:glycosyltransferase involved in cell wall biosynthesis